MGCIIVVFGVGGDCDWLKCLLMGQVVCDYVDLVFVIDDNFCSEDLFVICVEVMVGVGFDVIEVGDWVEVILCGVDVLQLGDVLLIVGKGYEIGQIIGYDVYFFDDVEQVLVVVVVLDGCI